MTKTYKIGNKEIQGISKWDKETLGVQETITEMCQRDLELKATITSLLEALSDKEEIHNIKTCEVCKSGLTCHKYVKSIACGKEDKTKQEEYNKGCLCDTKDICLLHAHGKQKEKSWQQMVIDNVPRKQEGCEHEISGKCVKCGKDSLGSKQSTSLKEQVYNQIYWNDRDVNDITMERTETILKLLQSHLLKEIETLEPSKYVQMVDACLEGYNICKEDIIKIINNI